MSSFEVQVWYTATDTKLTHESFQSMPDALAWIKKRAKEDWKFDPKFLFKGQRLNVSLERDCMVNVEES